MHICAPVGIIIYHFFTKVNSRLSRALFIGEPRKQLAVLGNFDHINWPFRETEYTEHTEIMGLFVQFGLQNWTIRTKKDAKNSHGAARVVEDASSSFVTQTIKGVHNAFELWAPFIFWVKVLACGHSAKPSAVIDGILGVVGWASKNLLNDGFYAAKSTKQGENGKNLRLFAIFDYATWQGSASSVAPRPRSPEREVLFATRRAYTPSLTQCSTQTKSAIFNIFYTKNRVDCTQRQQRRLQSMTVISVHFQ
jgi:hypothetical protein